MEGTALDAVDRAILYHLQENARRAITDIADAVNVSDNTVRNRIEKLEDEGVIQGYSVDLNYDQAEVQHYYLFVCSARVSNREELASDVREFSGVVEVITLMTGARNVIVLAVGSQKDDITQLAYNVDDLGLEVNDEYLIREHVHQPFEEFELDQEV